MLLLSQNNNVHKADRNQMVSHVGGLSEQPWNLFWHTYKIKLPISTIYADRVSSSIGKVWGFVVVETPKGQDDCNSKTKGYISRMAEHSLGSIRATNYPFRNRTHCNFWHSKGARRKGCIKILACTKSPGQERKMMHYSGCSYAIHETAVALKSSGAFSVGPGPVGSF